MWSGGLGRGVRGDRGTPGPDEIGAERPCLRSPGLSVLIVNRKSLGSNFTFSFYFASSSIIDSCFFKKFYCLYDTTPEKANKVGSKVSTTASSVSSIFKFRSNPSK